MSLPAGLDTQNIHLVCIVKANGDKSVRMISGSDLKGLKELVDDPTHVKLTVYAVMDVTLVGRHEVTLVTEGILVPK